MKNNLLRTLMDWTLAASLLLSFIFFVQLCFRSRDVRALQPQLQGEMMKYQSGRVMIQALVNDCLEYSKSNPSIDPILRSVGAKPAEPVPTKPAAR